MFNKERCYFHPRHLVVGVCALCLNEKLIELAEKKGHLLHRKPKSSNHRTTNSSVSLHKVFALGSLLNRLDIRQHKSGEYGSGASTSQDDSFISLEFEDNKGPISSWGKGTVAKVSRDNCHEEMSHERLKDVMEHSKPRPSSLRWRKRIGHLFHLVRWKQRSSKGSVCHVSTKMQEGVKVKHGWIRSLTKKTRTT